VKFINVQNLKEFQEEALPINLRDNHGAQEKGSAEGTQQKSDRKGSL